MRDTIILLCNLTDAMADPWIEAGYRVVMVDPQHERTEMVGQVTRMACTILDAASDLGRLIRSGRNCARRRLPAMHRRGRIRRPLVGRKARS
jgi:hypothetical protein